MFQKIKTFIAAHKFITAIIIIALIVGGYYWYKTANGEAVTQYIMASVEKGTIISSITGSGQISASRQIDIKPKASGEIVSVGVKAGQSASLGSLLASIDSTEARKSVRDAKLNLKSAKLSLKKLKQPAGALSILQAENALAQAKRNLKDLQNLPDSFDVLQAENDLAQAKESRVSAEDDLLKTYDDGFNTVADAFLDLPDIMIGLKNTLFGTTIERSYYNVDWYESHVVEADANQAKKHKNKVVNSYNSIEDKYDENFDDYYDASRSSDTETLEALIVETYDTTKLLADVIKDSNNYLDFVESSINSSTTLITVPALLATHQSALDAYTAEANSHLLALLAIKQTIQDKKEAITNAERLVAEETETLEKLKKGTDEDDILAAEESVREKEESLVDLKAGADELDIRAQELTIKQRENSLADAKSKLADYSVRAPFNGVIAKVNVKPNDIVSTGDTAATIIANQRVAEIDLNEVDVTRIQLGQKATLTFDAIEDFTITGEVAEIDALGTVTQGVVVYTVKITFDTGDERVKPGMSVSAAIITDVKQDALTVPSSAVKTQGDASYVEMFEDETQYMQGSHGVIAVTAPVQQIVETGISDDTSIEIISGLEEGDRIIARTVNNSSSQTSSSNQAPGGFFAPGPPRIR